MTLEDIYNQFPIKRDCINHLETLIWNNNPICPYCKSNHFTSFQEDNRYHCNTCNTSYSVTVGTLFHKTKIDLQKWFYAIYLVKESNSKITSRDLAKKINTTKDTAWRIIDNIKADIIKGNTITDKIIRYGE